MEALAICSPGHLQCNPCGAKASLGRLCGAHLGYHTLNVIFCPPMSRKLHRELLQYASLHILNLISCRLSHYGL